MVATSLPLTQTAQLCLDGHVAMLGERGEVALGFPLPKFGEVPVDAVLSQVQEQETAQYGGVYAMGDFRAVVTKAAFPVRPMKGTLCQIRGEQWKVKDPTLENSVTYQLTITRFLR